MSKTKKKLFYSAIVAVAILLAFVAAVFVTAPQGAIVSETGEWQSPLNTVNVGMSASEAAVETSIGGPGTVADSDKVTNNVVSGAKPINNAQDLEDALKNGGTRYLTTSFSYDASQSASSAAASGSFDGVIYGNGHTITVDIGDSMSYDASSSDGTYGFIVKTLSGGTIRDLNVVISSYTSSYSRFGIKLSTMKYQDQPERNRGVNQAYKACIGGIAGEVTNNGVIHNCTVTYQGNLALVNNGAVPGRANAVEWGKNCVYYFGGIVGSAEDSTIMYSEVNYDGNVVHAGQLNKGGSNMMIATGGVAGRVNGSAVMRKTYVQGSGILASEGHITSQGWTTSVPSSDFYTGGIVGWVSVNGSLDVNGVYLNLTHLSTSSEGSPWGGTDNMSRGNSGAVKTYFYAYDNASGSHGITQWYDSVENDGRDNISTDENAHMMRSSYGVGAAQTGRPVKLSNVYVSSQMDNVIKKHHPYAVNYIQQGVSSTTSAKNNSVWQKYRWVYNVVSSENGIGDFEFAQYKNRKTGETTIYISTASGSTLADFKDEQRLVYQKYQNNSENNFVYKITVGGDVYDVSGQTYNNFGNAGVLWIPVRYTAYNSTNNQNIVDSNYVVAQGTDNYSPRVIYETVAEYASYLYMDYDMSRGYDGTDRALDGYQGSGGNYTYVYNGEMLYVPSFAGYLTGYGTGGKIIFDQDELNSILGSSTNFSLSSSNTIVNSSTVEYSQYKWIHWENAGNVGIYSMSYNKPADSGPKFITKDGKNYYCALDGDYTNKTINVVPYTLSLNWNADGFVYNGATKDVTADFASTPSARNEINLGNNDADKLGVALAYSADNPALLENNKPYHAGQYTVTANLTYNNTTEDPMKGNFELPDSSYSFSVGKVQMTVSPSDVVSVYGNTHTDVLAAAKVTVGGNWVGEDSAFFTFSVKTVDDTVGFATKTGDYPTTVTASLTEGAVAEKLGDYKFAVTEGKLTIEARPINGVLSINEGVYNGSEYAATLALEDGVRVSTDSVYTLDYEKNGETAGYVVNAGEYLIRITPEADKYKIGTIIIQGKDEIYENGVTKLTVEQRNVDVTLAFDNGYVYDGANKVTSVALQQQEGNAGILNGESVQAIMSYNGEAEAIFPAAYATSVTFDSSNYKAGTIAGGEFTIERAELTVNVDSDSATYDGTGKNIGYTLVGVANEEDMLALVGTVTVTYNAAATAPVNAGVYAVEIVVAEGKAYKATSVSAQFTVNKAQIAFEPVRETVYTGKDISPEYAITAPGMDDASSLESFVTESHSVIHNATTYDVKLSFAGTNNYEPKEETYQLTVKRADLSVSLDDAQMLTYNGGAQTPVYSVSALAEDDEYGAVTLTTAGDGLVEGNAVNAGSYTFTLAIEESTNYNAVDMTVSFTIEKYRLTVIGASEQFIPVINENETEVTAIERYLPSLDVVLVDATGVYDNGDLAYATKVGDAPASEIVFSDGKGVFTADITVNGLDENNYAFDTVTIIVNVLDASIKITVNGEETVLAEAVFGDALEISAKGRYGENAEEDVQSVTWYAKGESGEYNVELGAEVPTDAGEYMASFRYTFGQDSNYVARALYLAISPKAVNVTLDGSSVSIIYGDEPVLDGATYSSDDNGITLEITYSTDAVRYSEVGAYNLYGEIAGVKTGDVDGKTSNYSFTVENGKVNVVPKTVYLKADNVSATYGDEVIFSSFTVYEDDGSTVWSGYADAAKIKATFSVQSGILTVGEYDVSISGENANYNVMSVTEKGKLTIEKRRIVLTVDDVSVVYGSTELPVFKGSIIEGNLVNGDSLGLVTGTYKEGVTALGELGVNDGGYVLTEYVTLKETLVSAQQGDNYEISFADTSKLFVTPKHIVVTFIGWQSDGALGIDSATYNAKEWTPSATLEGVINEDEVTVAYDGGEVKNAGSYAKVLTLGGADADNYYADSCTASLEILPYKTEISVGDVAEYVYEYGEGKTAIDPSVRLLDGDSQDGSFVQKNYVGTETGVTGIQVSWDSVWNVGVYTVVIAYSGVNYVADPVTVSITVEKKVLAKVDPKQIGNGSSVYNATNISLTAADVADMSAFEGLEDYIYIVIALNGNPATVIRNVGNYTVDLRLADNGNYEIDGGGDSLLNTLATYEITKADASNLSFSLTFGNKLYDGTDMTEYIKSVIAVSGIGGEPVTGATLQLVIKNGNGEEDIPLNSGVYKIEVAASGMTNYNDTQMNEAGDFTIDKVYVAADMITLDNKTTVYNAAEQTLGANGIVDSAVLLKVEYEYTATDFSSFTGAIDAGKYQVTMRVLFDKLNSRFSDDVTPNEVNDPDFGDVYEFVFTAELDITAATPTISLDKNTLANYFDGYGHSIEFTLSGVGNDSTMASAYDASLGVDNAVTIEGLGSFTVSYYTDAAYGNKLVDTSGAAAVPTTVLLSDGKTQPYYMMVQFVSENPNYSDFEYKNSGYDMALYIMQSVVTLSFGSLSVQYGQLGSQAAANEYVKNNMAYTYTVNDEGSASVNYDPEAMLEISYNLTSFDVNAGTYDIAISAVAAKTEFASSVTAVIRNANNVKLTVTPADVTDAMKATFVGTEDSYGNKTYTESDFAWQLKGIRNEDVAYTVSYNGESEFSISDAGEYVIDIAISSGNYKAWTGSVKLVINKVGVDVVWTLGGEEPVNGVLSKTYDGRPAELTVTVAGVEGLEADYVYVNSEGTEIDAPYVVGSHRAKAVLANDNYYINAGSEYVTVEIGYVELDEATIREWISDDSDVYGSVQGIDITGLPEGYGAVSVVYTDGVDTYDSETIKTAKAGTYSATVTVSNASSTGSAVFTYTIEKMGVTFTVNASVAFGKKPTAADVKMGSDKALASGDTASVSEVTFTSAYNEKLAFGTYSMKDYFASVTVAFNRNADCYVYKIVMGTFTVTPSSAPEISEVGANYNTATVKLPTEGVYAYKIGVRGTWTTMSSASDTILVAGLNANTSYTVYVAYAGFTDSYSTKTFTTTADPAKLSEMIEEINEGGLTLEKQEQYDSILAYYETIAESDRAEIQAEYDALVAQFNALKENQGESGGEVSPKPVEIDAAVLAVCIVCIVLIVASVAGVIAAAIVRKRREKNALKSDGNLV